MRGGEGGQKRDTSLGRGTGTRMRPVLLSLPTNDLLGSPPTPASRCCSGPSPGASLTLRTLVRLLSVFCGLKPSAFLPLAYRSLTEWPSAFCSPMQLSGGCVLEFVSCHRWNMQEKYTATSLGHVLLCPLPLTSLWSGASSLKGTQPVITNASQAHAPAGWQL